MSESYPRSQAHKLNPLRLLTRLLAIAVTATIAQAGVIFSTPRVSSFGPNFGAGTLNGSAAGAAQDGGAWLSLSGSGSFTSSFEFTDAGDGPLLLWAGSGSGTFDSSTMPGSWDFTVTSPASLSVDWTLTFTINPAEVVAFALVGGPSVTTFSGTTAGGGGHIVNPSALINTPQGETFTGYQVTLLVTFWADAEGRVLSVDIPALTSIDLNHAAAEVPEPGAFVLAGAGVLLLAAARLRRRKLGQ